MDSADDVNLVQHIAEVIIRNTSADSEREDFWSKAEKNLLMALIHYVQSLTYPNSDSCFHRKNAVWEPYTVCSLQPLLLKWTPGSGRFLQASGASPLRHFPSGASQYLGKYHDRTWFQTECIPKQAGRQHYEI